MSPKISLPKDPYPKEWGRKEPVEWRDEYVEDRPVYEAYCERLRALLEELLTAEDIPYHIVEARAKTPESFLIKLEGNPQNYKYPFSDMKDLTALRIILMFQSDVDRTLVLLKRELSSKIEDKRKRNDPTNFGYSSVHVDVSLKGNRKTSREWVKYKALFAEIQVRTVLEHGWVAVSHALEYKSKLEWPKELKRKLNKLIASLNLIDEEFDRIRDESDRIRKDYSNDISKGDFSQSLDRLSLETFIDESEIVGRISGIAYKSGLRPYETKVDIITQLLFISKELGIKTIADLDDQLKGLEPQTGVFFKELAANLRNESRPKGFIILSLIVGANFARVDPRLFGSFLWWSPGTIRAVMAAAIKSKIFHGHIRY